MRTPRFAHLAVAALATLGCATSGSTASGPYEQSHVIVDAPGGRYDLLLTRNSDDLLHGYRIANLRPGSLVQPLP